MSGFFSLATGISNKEEGHHHQQQDQDQDQDQDQEVEGSGLYLFKNEEIYNKGFELWQQYYQLHHHQHHHLQNHHQQLQDHHDSILLGVGPSRRNITSFTLGSSDHNNNNNTTKAIMMRQAAGFGFGAAGEGGGGSGGGGINCQDCGNQAKKDCSHMRCRTCCKSRGFPCQTHVKSTWVPAAKRRERQQQLASLTHSQQQQQQQQSLQNQQLSLMMRGGRSSDQNLKRLREENPTHHQLSLPTQHHHSTGLELGNFPAEVSSPAVFRCVRVSAMDDADEQFAYQTAVNVAGHTFKGILYDQGPEGRYNTGGGESSSGGGAGGSHQQPPQALNLITSAVTTGVATSNIPAVTFIDPASIYPTPLSAFMAADSPFNFRRDFHHESFENSLSVLNTVIRLRTSDSLLPRRRWELL